MTELEYKLMSAIGIAIDRVADFSDEMEEFACELVKKKHDRAWELSISVLEINDILADIFHKTVEENKEEWEALQKAECRIISKQISTKTERRIEHGTV